MILHFIAVRRAVACLLAVLQGASAQPERIARGIVGSDAVKLERGVYRATVDTSPTVSFDDVHFGDDASGCRCPHPDESAPMKPSMQILLALVLTAAFGDVWAAWPPSRCEHVVVLDSGDTDQVSWRFDGGLPALGSRLDGARPNQLDTLGEALDLLPDILCQAVRKVAFVYRPPLPGTSTIISGWTSKNDRQNILYLNTHSLSPWNDSSLRASKAARQDAIHRAVHESAHLAVRLLQSQQEASPLGTLQERPGAELWPANAQRLAQDIIKANRLENGVVREWQRIHAAFVAAGMAESYYGGNWSEKDGFSDEALAAAGFMSAYGGDNPDEDIAEMTSWAILGSVHSQPANAACKVMTGRAQPRVTSEDAAVFTKLGFVRSLNFISKQDYESCIGKLNIGAPSKGFHSYKNGVPGRSYAGSVRAGAGRAADGEHFLFEMEADGVVGTTSGEVAARMVLILDITRPVDSWTDPGRAHERAGATLDELSYPRGVYLIGFRHSKHNRLQIARRDDGGLIMDVGQGLALIGHASSDAIEGSVVVQRVFNYSGGLLSAIAGDEPVSEDSRVTFRYEPGGGD